MPSIVRVAVVSALLVTVQGQGVIQSAQGTTGSPASLPLQVQLAQSDANVINDNEINLNAVNECGRTLLGGNIDIGEQTENQLANKTVTSVTKGGKLAVTIKQGDANGAGPYSCDLDLTSNSNGVTGQTNLSMTETDGTDGTISLSLTMPTDLACTGASTGNVCTVRCRNTNAAGPFGGCFAVQQTDITAKVNTPQNIATQQTLDGVMAQIAQDQKDLAKAVAANAGAGSTESDQSLAAVNALLNIDSSKQATASAAAAAGATSSASASKSGKKNGNKNKNNRRTVVRPSMRHAKRYVLPGADFNDGGDQA